MPHTEAGERRFQGGEAALRAMFIPDTFAPIRLTLVPATGDAIATVSVRHVFRPRTHQSRIFQAKDKIQRGTRKKLWSRVKR